MDGGSLEKVIEDQDFFLEMEWELQRQQKGKKWDGYEVMARGRRRKEAGRERDIQ